MATPYGEQQKQREIAAVTAPVNTIRIGNPAIGRQESSAQEMPEVARELELLNSQLMHLESLVATMCRRLQPVTLAVPATPPTETSVKERECYSVVGQTIAGARNSLRTQIQALLGVLETLAV